MAKGERGEEDYSRLRDVRVSLDRVAAAAEAEAEAEAEGGGGFSLCFWLYLSSSARPSSVILRQTTSDVREDVPFLALSEENKLILFPLVLLHKEASSAGSSFPWTDLTHVSAMNECPPEKWVHVGCEVARKSVRLHIDGNLVSEMKLSSLCEDHKYRDDLKRITLVGNDEKLEDYVYNIHVLPLSTTVKQQYEKNPPVKLSLDGTCSSDGVEEGGDGVWSIVGGKASCRRNFSLEVVLLDAFGQAVHKEMEIAASLVYADNGAPVEKSRDEKEAPLLTSCDGLEYPSSDKPVSLLRGRATFKLKISQLSSKSDNRLFRVRFHSLHNTQGYPFLETYSHPIRCISRNRSTRPYGSGKRATSATLLLDELHSLKLNNGHGLIRDYSKDNHSQKESRSSFGCSSPPKRFKIDYDGSPMALDSNGMSEQPCKTNVEGRSNNTEGSGSAPSDSESTDAKNFESRWMRDSTEPFSDALIFRYCLEGTHERSKLLKEAVTLASDEEMANFSDQICLYTGCSHHRNQILLSKRLIQEGVDTWTAISRNNNRVLWSYAVPEIIRKFMYIACSADRGLSTQDTEVLRQIAGCGDDLGREEFDRLWYWLYPVAFSLTHEKLKKIWECTSPKWIEGFITREEAENALKGPQGPQKPGTFVLRFPTSRSWPHPDAGSIVVAYVASDSSIRHRLLSLDLSDDREKYLTPLQDLLLEEPELSHLGRQVNAGTLNSEAEANMLEYHGESSCNSTSQGD
ncbi:hypothetical protein ACMD2_11743 [Ananas comosus]|uniref:SH2 domain-containing protein n=1 Tax=Ananas comosus TaxID=4615 RepID=A0A199UQ45_ANACO|nr:hypothetical protein ACMD2_11743 [Ananas comosus]